jgi:hypothetical protein
MTCVEKVTESDYLAVLAMVFDLKVMRLEQLDVQEFGMGRDVSKSFLVYPILLQLAPSCVFLSITFEKKKKQI